MKRFKKESLFQKLVVVCMTIGLLFTQFSYTTLGEELPWEPSEHSIHDLPKSPTVDQNVGTPLACFFAWDVSLDSEEVKSQSLEELNQTILEKANPRIYTQPHDNPDNLLTRTTTPERPQIQILLADLQQLKTVNESLPEEQTLLQEVHLVVTGHYEGTMGIDIHLERKPHSGGPDGNGSGGGGEQQNNGPLDQNTSTGNDILPSEPGGVKMVNRYLDSLSSQEFYGAESVDSDKSKNVDEILSQKGKMVASMGGQDFSIAINENSVENKENQLFSFWDGVGLILIGVALLIIIVLFVGILSDFRVIRWYHRKR